MKCRVEEVRNKEKEIDKRKKVNYTCWSPINDVLNNVCFASRRPRTGRAHRAGRPHCTAARIARHYRTLSINEQNYSQVEKEGIFLCYRSLISFYMGDTLYCALIANF